MRTEQEIHVDGIKKTKYKQNIIKVTKKCISLECYVGKSKFVPGDRICLRSYVVDLVRYTSLGLDKCAKRLSFNVCKCFDTRWLAKDLVQLPSSH